MELEAVRCPVSVKICANQVCTDLDADWIVPTGIGTPPPPNKYGLDWFFIWNNVVTKNIVTWLICIWIKCAQTWCSLWSGTGSTFRATRGQVATSHATPMSLSSLSDWIADWWRRYLWRPVQSWRGGIPPGILCPHPEERCWVPTQVLLADRRHWHLLPFEAPLSFTYRSTWLYTPPADPSAPLVAPAAPPAPRISCRVSRPVPTTEDVDMTGAPSSSYQGPPNASTTYILYLFFIRHEDTYYDFLSINKFKLWKK